ncbi:MAG: hypothetical protein EOO62_15795 [Hymenobacter sp.]|nr:MAG: hypothetical protein EOO62_15795 [Hymenobacter sp.]
MRRRHSVLLLAALLPLAFGCQKTAETPDCGTSATVRNLRLDGCGFVLELADGKHLEPHGDLWQNYAKKDGAKVTIGYVEEPMVSICMAGAGVRLTCIQE